jgi:hypothetical protein
MFSLGDISKIPAPMLKEPKGIRSADEWYISLSVRRDYVYKVFERQTEINLAKTSSLWCRWPMCWPCMKRRSVAAATRYDLTNHIKPNY